MLVPALLAGAAAFAITAGLGVGAAGPLPHRWVLAAVAMSAVALAPLVFSGSRTLPRRARRRLRHTAFAATVVVGGFVLLGLLTAGVARPRLELGLAQTQKGLGAVRAGNQAEAVSHFDVARGAFERAQDTLETWWATPARSVPIVAQQLRVLRGVAKSGRELSGTGAVTLSAGDIGFRVVGGQVPLDKLKAIRDPLARATTVMNHVSDP